MRCLFQRAHEGARELAERSSEHGCTGEGQVLQDVKVSRVLARTGRKWEPAAVRQMSSWRETLHAFDSKVGLDNHVNWIFPQVKVRISDSSVEDGAKGWLTHSSLSDSWTSSATADSHMNVENEAEVSNNEGKLSGHPGAHLSFMHPCLRPLFENGGQTEALYFGLDSVKVHRPKRTFKVVKHFSELILWGSLLSECVTFFFFLKSCHRSQKL